MRVANVFLVTLYLYHIPMVMSWVKSILLTLVAVVAVITTAMAQQRATLPDSTSAGYRHTDAVKELSIRRDTARARKIWHEIVERDSTYSPALYYLSITASDSKQSLHYAQRAFYADTTNKWYVDNYAEQLVANGRYTNAIPVFRRLMRIDPTYLRSYHALAIIYSFSSMPYSAISILDSAELRIGYNPYLAEIKQELLLSTHQFERAITEGKRRIVEHPYDPAIITQLADIYAVAGRDSLARATYDQAFKFDTTNFETIISIADYYQRAGNTTRMLDYEQHLFRNEKVDVESKLYRITQYTDDMNFYAANYYRVGGIIRQMAIDYPNNRDLRKIYAQHLIYGGGHSEALEYLVGHLEDEGVEPEDYIFVIQLENYLERKDLMNREMARALELYPYNTSLLSLYSYICSQRGDYKSAISVMEWALTGIEDDKERSVLMGNIGDLYHEMGEDKSAFRYYKRALALDADNALVLNNYAYFLSLLDKNLDDALVMAERAMSLKPNIASYVDTYAWVLHRMGRNEEAKRVMRQALTLSSQSDASLLMHYGDILWALGEKFMAETYWQKAIERGYDKAAMESHIKEIKSKK